ncbi:MAG: flavodoxin-dependent (E)-4-hydroxy-3-methylbut-2-enyl-diphosphate synthase [Clostridia bacterium]|nr:flavodoxin-dependent (E)-4-hydroxy-3-methylbut-2-enyl-diphosphate synthase [Clostridia bacterium]
MIDYQNIRRKTRAVKVGNVVIGGSAKISIQSMTNTDTMDSVATISQVSALEKAGCDIVRITVPNVESASTITKIKESGIRVPIVADIHFDYKAALACAERGVDKIRINPGNIGDDSRVKAVVDACKQNNIPIRIGVNSGSLEKHILAKHGSPTPEALCESAMYHAALLEKFDFDDIVISIKGSSVEQMIKANRLVAERCEYPIHIGVTEAGSEEYGMIKSAAGIGALLCDGIGDTMRVSLTADPVREVRAAKSILNALEIQGQCGMNIVSCPTCGRTKIDLILLENQFRAVAEREGLKDYPIKVALMGCIVNGPGEAREADIGIAGGQGEALLISHGEIIKKIKEDEIIETLIIAIKEMRNNNIG